MTKRVLTLDNLRVESFETSGAVEQSLGEVLREAAVRRDTAPWMVTCSCKCPEW